MNRCSSKRSLAHVRTKTGCLTCRERRKKCDEIKPTCSGCARNFIDCKWPSLLVLNSGSCTSRSNPKGSLNDGLLADTFYAQQDSSDPTSPGIDALVTRVLSPSLAERYAEVATPAHGCWKKRHGKPDGSDSTVVWQPLSASFMSPQRATLLTSSSLLLLQHYMESTSTFLVAKPLSSNPFHAVVLPLAFTDDLLMHALLALSGTHLAFRRGGDLDIQTATRTHYSLLLRNLRTTFEDKALYDDVRKMSRLLLVLVVLSHVEVCHA